MVTSKLETVLSLSRQRSLQTLLTMAMLYLALVFFYEFPFVSHSISSSGTVSGGAGFLAGGDAMPRPRPLDSEEETIHKSAPARPSKRPYRRLAHSSPAARIPGAPFVSGLLFRGVNETSLGAFSELHKAAGQAWEAGQKLFEELRTAPPSPAGAPEENRTVESCPHSIVLAGTDLRERGRLMLLPCGLMLGSHITLIGKPHPAHPEHDPKISIRKQEDQAVMVSQFMMELQGLRTVDGEDPPRILHFNPRLKGDWSGRPVIEQNTCYRMQWGTPLRCDGRKSRDDEDTVDGRVKCEKWIREDDPKSEESKTAWWSNHLIRDTRKGPIDLMYPFVEDKMFVLTLSAGLEGYHVSVDGGHVASFPYRPGFVLEDATGLALNGDIDIQSIFAASLPTSHPIFSPQRNLEFLPQWQASPIPNGPVELFIGILSAGNHFAERMAVRKSWMSSVRKSSNVVARFFVALHGRKEVNMELKKELEFFRDIIIVPFMDSYDLVVLKTAAICEYGVRTVSAKYIMKCDDDTFVRIDSVIKEVRKVPGDRSLYVGNMNYYHKPMRFGKWAVKYEEWPEEEYPTYANGPGYIITADIARFVMSEFENHTLKLFKMEDVSMGMWVEQFNTSRPVEYVHSLKFCQFGCIEGYYTAHYQSPRQMICLSDKLQAGKPQCCNMR